MKNAREIQTMDRVIEILDKPEKWVKGIISCDKNGNRTNPPNPATTCWCLEGAIYTALWEQKLTKRKWFNSHRKIVHAICRVAGFRYDIGHQSEHVEFNDHEDTTYEILVNTLKKAKAFLKGETE